ncbi:MAG TPA: tetratricopeptide repeat protein [Sphingomicrobium sp.]|nr:tetratricopeptide repeat protein [Sphingomicrobium sp.]
MGWIILLALFAASLGLLWFLGARGGLLTAGAAALMLGATGYALQGSPALDGERAQDGGRQQAQSLTQARHAFFGNFSPEESWLLLAEGLERAGNTEDAVGILQNAVGRYPTDAQLWVGLGNALVNHGHGLTPPAEFAYRRASELMPGHPAPRFFYDLALLRSGQGEAATRDLVALMREYPGASWRPVVGGLLMALASNGQVQPAVRR